MGLKTFNSSPKLLDMDPTPEMIETVRIMQDMERVREGEGEVVFSIRKDTDRLFCYDYRAPSPRVRVTDIPDDMESRVRDMREAYDMALAFTRLENTDHFRISASSMRNPVGQPWHFDHANVTIGAAVRFTKPRPIQYLVGDVQLNLGSLGSYFVPELISLLGIANRYTKVNDIDRKVKKLIEGETVNVASVLPWKILIVEPGDFHRADDYRDAELNLLDEYDENLDPRVILLSRYIARISDE